MKATLLKATIILFLFTITLSGNAFAQNAIVGVYPGNKFDYSYVATWSSTDPKAIVPATYVDLNNTEFIRISILNVTGTLINVDFTRQFKNGTVVKQNGNIDVNTQILEIPYAVLIIRADANPDEKIYPAGGHATLNETEFRTYSIGRVETIHYLSPIASEANYEKTEIFYDRANGVGIEYTFEARETSDLGVTTTKVTLMLTSMDASANPSVSQTPSSVIEPNIIPASTATPKPITNSSNTFFIIAGVVIAVVVIAGLVLILRRRKQQ